MLELKNVVKYVGDRRLLKINELKIVAGEKIGIVGVNGVGKSTLLGIMAGTIRPDQGQVIRYTDLSYMQQLDTVRPENDEVNPVVAGKLSIRREYTDFLSGGERTRYKIAAALSEEKPLLLADEPTANLDINGRELLESMFQTFSGALVIISHDRQLLDAISEVIWEIEDGELKIYPGNYTDYLVQKENDRRHREREYEKYIDNKRQLEAAIVERRARSAAARKAPARMGNAEARLHKMGNQKGKANLDKAVKAMETRLKKLEIKGKPKEQRSASFDFISSGDLASRVVIRGERINKCFGDRFLFHNAEFTLQNRQKAALFGPNGSGKTTLLNMIVRRDEGIYLSAQARIGYFRQGMDDLNLDRSILENVLVTSVQGEGAVRNLLAQLLFRREDVFKKAAVLSGGERTRVSLARIIASDANVLLLDEPTNYLDLSSLEALEDVLTEYRGTLLFVSHDRKFINRVATHLMIVDSGKLRLFEGSYREYFEFQNQQRENFTKESKMVLENRLSEILSRMSLTKDKEEAAKLESEYQKLLTLLRA